MKGILTRLKDMLAIPQVNNYCPVCKVKGIPFAPLPDYYRQNALANGFMHFGQGEMTAHESYSCTQCGASDRERLYALWIGQQIEKHQFPKGTRLIHFAPEAALSTNLKEMEIFHYQNADLLMEDVDYKVDMMNMPFEDESFDFFICSHVLEHVESDDKAIQELFRITKHGGCGILMAPIIVGLDKTIEDPNIKDDAGRWRMFGQNDHLRLYAHDDYVGKIANNGFRVKELGKEYFGSKVFRKLGLKPTSILYVVSK